VTPLSFEPVTGDFRERVRSQFDGQAFMGLIGARLGAVEPGSVEIVLPYRVELTQQHGFVHGGVIASLADTAAGFAAFSLMDGAEQPLSVEFKVNLMSAARGDRLEIRAEVLKNGRTLKICRADVHDVTPETRTLCATALVTVIALRGWRP
jgi:uncharacterized protein (TIGR00369 family)